jgi:hypothetical protein
MERPVRINPDTTTTTSVEKGGKPQLFSDSASVLRDFQEFLRLQRAASFRLGVLRMRGSQFLSKAFRAAIISISRATSKVWDS